MKRVFSKEGVVSGKDVMGLAPPRRKKPVVSKSMRESAAPPKASAKASATATPTAHHRGVEKGHPPFHAQQATVLRMNVGSEVQNSNGWCIPSEIVAPRGLPLPQENKASSLGGGKKTVCRFYVQFKCQKGNDCPFSHDVERESKTETCRYHIAGLCAKGSDCPFSHDLSKHPCKFFHGKGRCTAGEDCRFSHQRLTESQRRIVDEEIIRDKLLEEKQKMAAAKSEGTKAAIPSGSGGKSDAGCEYPLFAQETGLPRASLDPECNNGKTGDALSDTKNAAQSDPVNQDALTLALDLM